MRKNRCRPKEGISPSIKSRQAHPSPQRSEAITVASSRGKHSVGSPSSQPSNHHHNTTESSEPLERAWNHHSSVVKLQNTQTTVVRGSVTPQPSILTILDKGRSPARNVQLATKRQGPNHKNLTNNAAPCYVVLLCKRHCRGVTSVGNVAVPPSYARLNLRAAAPKHSIVPPDPDRQQGTNKKTIQGFLKSPRPESSVSCQTN
jgi:hypothetical protein